MNALNEDSTLTFMQMAFARCQLEAGMPGAVPSTDKSKARGLRKEKQDLPRNNKILIKFCFHLQQERDSGVSEQFAFFFPQAEMKEK